MGRPKKAVGGAGSEVAQQRRGQAPKQVQAAIERHRADEALAAKEERIQTLKNAMHKATGDVCAEVEKGIDQRFSPAFVKAMAEASFHFAETVVRDVEAFRKHARRATATADDVKLCTRRNRSLQRHIGDFAEKLAASRAADKPAKPAAEAVERDDFDDEALLATDGLEEI